MTAPAGRGATDGDPPAGPRLLDEEALRDWGRRLGRAAAEAGVFVALYGPLGAGKSTLARAAASGAGVEGAVPSPTYTLVHEHGLPAGEGDRRTGPASRADGGGRVLFHVDLYRLSGDRDLDEIGWDRMLASGGPVLVEWADRAGESLPRDRWDVRLEIPEDRGRRRVELARRGAAPDPPPLPPDAPAADPPAGAAAEGETPAEDGPC